MLIIYIHLYGFWQDIGMMVRVFANGPGHWGSIPGHVIPRTQKIVLEASLLNTQHYKIWMKGKMKQSREKSNALPYTLVKKLLKREPLGHPQLQSPTLLNLYGFKVLRSNIKDLYTIIWHQVIIPFWSSLFICSLHSYMISSIPIKY